MKCTRTSILVSTSNRSEQLRRFLDRLPAAEMKRWAVEVVVVDNASQDDTHDVLLAFQEAGGVQIKVLHEPTPGKGRALNRGLLECAGDYIVLTDDDCYFAEDFFEVLTRLFEDQGIAYTGGRALPFDPSDSTIACIFNKRRKVYHPGSFISTGTFQGCNMAVRRSVLESIGGYDPLIGPGTPFRADDLDLVARMSVAGYLGVFEPDLVVFHHHGRKPGSETRALKRANDHSVGAHYAKFILDSHFKYLACWLVRASVPWRLHRTLREVRGALHYVRYVKEHRDIEQAVGPNMA